MALRRTEMPARPFRWDPPAHERHSRNAVVFAFPIGLRNCDLAERSSRVIEPAKAESNNANLRRNSYGALSDFLRLVSIP